MPGSERDRSAVVLVVEDEWEILDIVRDILEGEGYGVRTAGHGREALAVLAREPRVDVVLTDLMMPVMDGFDLVRELAQHREYRSIPVIVMTAATPDAIGMRELNARRVIRKPLRIDTLLHELSRAVG